MKYDLWDETFRVTLSVDGRVLTSETQVGRDAVLARLRDARLPSLFPESEPRAWRGVHAARGRAAEPDRRGAHGEDPQMGGREQCCTPGQAGVPDTSTTKKSNELFNRIFEQFAAGSANAAAWRETAVSSAFRPESVPHERP